MMSFKDEFPNPVLAAGKDDYIESCSFHTLLDDNGITVDKENINIPVKYSLVCNGLQTLINSEDAVVAISVRSSAASYSKLFKFPVGVTSMNISIPKFSVVNKMDITGSIIAAHNIDNFRCEDEFNDLYFGTSTFEIRKGDILAIEDSCSIYIDDSELERPISSIFNIIRCDNQKSDVMPNFEDEKIQIFLKSELYELYYKFKDFNNGMLRRYVTGVIVYPVLIEAVGYVISYYQNIDEPDGEIDYSCKRWFRAIDRKAEADGIDLHTYDGYPTTLANDMLGNIALDALKSFKDTLDSEMNSEETQIIGGVD